MKRIICRLFHSDYHIYQSVIYNYITGPNARWLVTCRKCGHKFWKMKAPFEVSR